MEDPKIWDDAKRAQELGREKKSLENIVLVLEEVDAGINDGRELFEMGKRVPGVEPITRMGLRFSAAK